MRVEIGGLRNEMHEGFAAINRRLDQIIQTQLDEHATRIKKLETAGFSNINIQVRRFRYSNLPAYLLTGLA